MRKLALVASILFTATASHADPWASRVAGAAEACRTGAQQLRALAADCRAHSEPPPEGGEYCTGVTFTATTPDGATQDYTYSPDQADELADSFDAHAPTLDAAADRIAELEDAAAVTEDKIRELGYDQTREDYEGWLALADSSRDELAAETRAFLVSRAFDAASGLADGIAQLTRRRAERLRDTLAHYGDAGVEVGKELVRIARIRGRRARAEAAAAVIERLQQIYDVATADDDLDALVSVLTDLVELDGFGFLVDEINWTTAAVYAYAASSIASDRMDQLAAMQAVKLRGLKSLSELLERQVGRVKAEVATLQGCAP